MQNIQYQSDNKIISMIAQRQIMGWVHLYDKYSSPMYGIIFILSKNKNIAESIFFDYFLHLEKNSEILTMQKNMLCPFLMQGTYTFGINELERIGLQPDTSTLGGSPKLIQLLLCAKYCLPVKEKTVGIELHSQSL
ncbi:MAG: hypothetical protein ABI168_06120 [Ginsengibacter sp.]